MHGHRIAVLLFNKGLSPSMPFQALIYYETLSQTSGSLQKKFPSQHYDFDIDMSQKLVARNNSDLT